ncbi:MAG TPA: ATP-grasp domain-containing protein [Candidatus Paceibacterota bacterium]|jgi:D-alanine-D-alanine ligase|nr:ATP-grasp domain-containing protein [Candidatus Paceibacterota bacterium]
MTRIIVGVLRGGTSSEYNLSLKTGAAMLNALPEDRYEARDIFIDKSGLWHLRGQPATPARALAQVDVVLNALHGGAGEDGSVQRLLEKLGVRYAGAKPIPSGLSLNKVRAREVLQGAGIRMPRAISFSLSNGLNTAEMAQAVFSQFGPPYVVKPASEGAGRGIVIAAHLLELPDAIGDVLDAYGSAIIEEYVRGHEVSIAVIQGFRNEDLYVLPPAHVRREGQFLTPDMHDAGTIAHSVPSPFSHVQKLSLADVARRAHKALDLGHFSRADAIVAPSGIYVLEVNAIPGLYPGASMPLMLDAVGSSVTEFLEHAIHLALGK